MMGHASGGKVKHDDETQDRALVKKMMKEEEKKEQKVEGKASGGRLDKYARGGRTKNPPVNVIVVAGGGKDKQPVPVPLPSGGPPPPLPPPPAARPPLPMGPPGGLPMGADAPPGPGVPPGLPPGGLPPRPLMRAHGGRIKDRPADSLTDEQQEKLLKRADGGKAGKYIPGDSSPNSLKRWAQYARKNSYAKGGRVSDYPITGGADSGQGRLDYHNHMRGK